MAEAQQGHTAAREWRCGKIRGVRNGHLERLHGENYTSINRLCLLCCCCRCCQGEVTTAGSSAAAGDALAPVVADGV
jgi:hypothetical protein